MQEGQWNGRFVNETIPDIFASKRNPRITAAKKKKS
jgi:hypothetical protein